MYVMIILLRHVYMTIDKKFLSHVYIAKTYKHSLNSMKMWVFPKTKMINLLLMISSIMQIIVTNIKRVAVEVCCLEFTKAEI